ncbi:LysR family transcriptional regulator [Variovorax paradoxus]|uniref:LysR family transcriptional regulator n=1 Tax=Variovorax paradoxus TaxID=34073 RepID=UPI002786FBE0|nr:LysR family transcriptional regulator [Variovorax paradoxus]MDP9932815.1 DNA-binding transcriptional LysR family regulator [Variovorax paradoxus]
MRTSASTLRNRLLSSARLRHLHVFVTVAELQTVKRAAEAVGISQPSATQALAELERLLECTLFLRHARGMALTPAGSQLLPLARRTLGIMDDAATQAAALAQSANEVVRVAAISAAIESHLGKTIHDFTQLHPRVLVHLQEADASRQASLVADGDVDCAFCRAPPVLPNGWSFTPLWPDRFAIVAGHAHPLARKRRVTMSDLVAATWLVTPTSMAAREAFDTFFAHAPTPIKMHGVVTNSATMLSSLLSQQHLLTFVPASIVRRGVESGLLAEISWAQRFPFSPIGLLVPHHGRGPALGSFTSYMQKTARDVLQDWHEPCVS